MKNNKEIVQSDKSEQPKGFCRWLVSLSLYTKAMLFLLALIIGSLICIIFFSDPSPNKDKSKDETGKLHNQTTTSINLNIDSNKEIATPVPVANKID